jgi:basic amino acid/polyamine antiporter, APA family
MNENIRAPALQRRLSFTMVVLYGLGTTIGAGIYVLIGKVVGNAGLFAPISFIVATILAGFSVFTFAELSSRFPLSAGEAVYVSKGLRSRHVAIAVGFCVVFAGIVSSAAISRGFLGYLQEFFDFTGWVVIVCLVVTLGAIAFWGIGQSVLIAGAATIIEISGLLLVIVASADSLESLPSALPSLMPQFELDAWSGIVAGAILAFYAFLGFEDMVNVAEEVKDARRTLPRALIATLIITTAFYILLTLVAVLSLSVEELSASSAPLALLFERSTGQSSTIISLIALVAVLNGALVQIIMSSRVLYGMSRRKWALAAFGRIHPATHTPHIATLCVTITVLVFALWLPLEVLAETTSFLTLTIFALVNLALWRIKRKEGADRTVEPHPDKAASVARVSASSESTIQFPIWVPAIGFVGSVGFLCLRTIGLANL